MYTSPSLAIFIFVAVGNFPSTWEYKFKCELGYNFPSHPWRENPRTMDSLHERSACNWTYTWSDHEVDRLPHTLPVARCEKVSTGNQLSLAKCVEVYYQVPVMRFTRTNQIWRWKPTWEKVAVSCTRVSPEFRQARLETIE